MEDHCVILGTCMTSLSLQFTWNSLCASPLNMTLLRTILITCASNLNHFIFLQFDTLKNWVFILVCTKIWLPKIKVFFENSRFINTHCVLHLQEKISSFKTDLRFFHICVFFPEFLNVLHIITSFPVPTQSLRICLLYYLQKIIKFCHLRKKFLVQWNMIIWIKTRALKYHLIFSILVFLCLKWRYQ